MALFNSAVLDLSIGIAFVYLLLASICTALNEWIAGLTSARAKTLAKGITQLLDQQKGVDPARTFLQEFYAHPLISGMMGPGKQPSEKHPSYLPSRTFATVIMDLTTKGKLGSINFADLENGFKNLPDGDVKTALLALTQNANGDLLQAQKNIEEWFDDSMERVSGWYKRHTQIVTIILAALLTLATNADTIRMGRVLWISGADRELLVEKAQDRVATAGSNPQTELEALQSVLGWSQRDLPAAGPWPLRILGWTLSVIAISLGAPFWFGLLSKLTNIRSAGVKPAKGNGREDDGRTSPQRAPLPA
jgi:hypothetical protein